MALDILVVDDEKDICQMIGAILGDEGYERRFAHTGEQALAEVKKRRPHLILLDIWLGESRFDGMKVLELVKADHSDLPVLMMSGHGTIETAVSAIKMGAYDFLEKPFKSDRLLILVERALETTRLRTENQELKQQVSCHEDLLVGSSAEVQKLQDMIVRLGATNSRVVLQGPPGAGKEMMARLIHLASARKTGPFVVLSCSGFSDKNLEERLFGREKGTSYSAGVFERAHNGTLYLDAVEEMSAELQGKIVKALQGNEIFRVGGQEPVQVNVRVISSTTTDLKALVDKGRLREDLYYRLNVVSFEIPSLAARREDLPALITHLSASLSQQLAVKTLKFTSDALLALQAYDWPGNIRQLHNLIEWLLIMCQGKNKGDVRLEDLPAEFIADSNAIFRDPQMLSLAGMPLREAREQFEKDYLVAQVERFAGNISKTAEFVGMERSALHRKLKGLEIKKA